MPPYQPSYDSDEADGIAAAAAATPSPELEHEPERDHDDVDPNVCPDCGRTFASKHALAVHRGRSHKLRPNGRPAIRPPATNGKAAPAAGAKAVRDRFSAGDVSDTLRELVGMFDRARELRDELELLEQEIAERQAQLAKAWTR